MPNLAVVLPFLGTALLLGLGLPLSRLASAAGMPPGAFAFWSTLGAGLVLGFIAWRRHGAIALDARLVRDGLVSGVVGHALPLSAALWLAAHAPSTVLSLAFALPPLLTQALSMIVGRRRATGRHAIVAGVGLAAVLLLAGGAGPVRASATEFVLALLIPAWIAAANVYRERAARPAPLEWLGAKMLLWSSAALAAIGSSGRGLALPADATALGWTLLQTLALIGGHALAFVLQRRTRPPLSSFAGYGTSFSGMAASGLLFGETPAPAALAAPLAIAAALWWLQAGSTAPADPTASPCGAACATCACADAAGCTAAA